MLPSWQLLYPNKSLQAFFLPEIDVDYQMDNQTFDENMVTIIEKWENFETLKNHMHAPHMLSYRKNVKDLVEYTSLKILSNT